MEPQQQPQPEGFFQRNLGVTRNDFLSFSLAMFWITAMTVAAVYGFFILIR